jgi:hypothetical protein
MTKNDPAEYQRARNAEMQRTGVLSLRRRWNDKTAREEREKMAPGL